MKTRKQRRMKSVRKGGGKWGKRFAAALAALTARTHGQTLNDELKKVVDYGTYKGSVKPLEEFKKHTMDERNVEMELHSFPSLAGLDLEFTKELQEVMPGATPQNFLDALNAARENRTISKTEYKRKLDTSLLFYLFESFYSGLNEGEATYYHTHYRDPTHAEFERRIKQSVKTNIRDRKKEAEEKDRKTKALMRQTSELRGDVQRKEDERRELENSLTLASRYMQYLKSLVPTNVTGNVTGNVTFDIYQLDLHEKSKFEKYTRILYDLLMVDPLISSAIVLAMLVVWGRMYKCFLDAIRENRHLRKVNATLKKNYSLIRSFVMERHPEMQVLIDHQRASRIYGEEGTVVNQVRHGIDHVNKDPNALLFLVEKVNQFGLKSPS